MTALRHALIGIGFEVLAAMVSLWLWQLTGDAAFLFIAGIAFGAAVVLAVLFLDQHQSIHAEMMERLDA